MRPSVTRIPIGKKGPGVNKWPEIYFCKSAFSGNEESNDGVLVLEADRAVCQ